MGKKARTTRGKARAEGRKLDHSELPPPPAAPDLEVGSTKLLTEPQLPGTTFKALDQDGYDDGGVADLTMVIDLEDTVLRRKRGETNYFHALKSDLLPRVQTGQYASLHRRDQKVRLARLLFSTDDDETAEESNPSEVYVDSVDGKEDEETTKHRKDRLNAAKFALRLSHVLREPACASLSLSEISKRYLSCYGKEKAEAALRCSDKAIEIASDGFWDNDEIGIEAQENPVPDPKYEKNATSHGLGHPENLKMQSKRVSLLCLRSAHLHRGNALSALGRDEDARSSYLLVLPMIEKEPRSCRLDWERNSCFVNIGNTYARQGNFVKANEYYDMAEKLGKDHVDAEHGNKVDGMALMIVSMRQRSFALKKAGKDDDAKKQMRAVLEMQQKLDVETVKQNAELKIFEEKQTAKNKEAQEKKEAEAYAAAIAAHKQRAETADSATSGSVEKLVAGLKSM